MKKAAATGRADFLGALGYVLGRVGCRDAARGILSDLEQADDAAAQSPAITRAIVHLGLGEEEAALGEVRACMDDHSWHVLIAYADPLFEPLRATGKLDGVFEQLGLSPLRPR